MCSINYTMTTMSTTPRDTPADRPIQVFYPWRPAFLAALRAGGSPVRACEAARIDRRWVYRVRSFDAEFRDEWDDAVAGHGDDLQAEAVRRAVRGVQELVLYRGKPVLVWMLNDGTVVPPGVPGATAVPLVRVKKSDALLMKLLAAARPEEFGRGRRVAAAAPKPTEAEVRDREAAAVRARFAAMTDAELDAEYVRLKALSPDNPGVASPEPSNACAPV